jgi:hypothetical protein
MATPARKLGQPPDYAPILITIFVPDVAISVTLAGSGKPMLSPDHGQIIGSSVLLGMGILFHLLNDMPLDFSMAKFMERSGLGYKSGLFLAVFAGALPTFLLAGLGCAVSGFYKAAAFCFTGASLCATISAFVRFRVFLGFFRALYTLVASLLIGVIMLWTYSYTCPDFKISPNVAIFETWAGQSYKFRITDMSENDIYMASFIFEITSHAYSVTDFTFSIPPESVKALDQQPAESDRKAADIFGLFGRWPSSHSFFLLYVYHFAPHESREVTITLLQHLPSTEREFEVRASPMFYSHNAVPISKINDFVMVPIGIDRDLTFTEFLPCWTDRKPPCYEHPQLGKHVGLPEGCNYWGVSNSPITQPLHVRFPENCD